MIEPVLTASLLLATTLTIDRAHVAATFDPRTAIGATVDVRGENETDEIYTPENIEAMLSAGFQPLSYRLATELGGEAWHWNPRGTWSDATNRQGYWTSSPAVREPIDVSYGYRLPRRGNTLSQSQNVDYSRIDDGDESTFWKSNPYLSPRPQWVLIDLGKRVDVHRMRISWGRPFARTYDVERWTGDDAINNPRVGTWQRIAHVADGRGGVALIALTASHARYVRIALDRSSGGNASDWRDNAGFAIREVSIDAHMKHGKSARTQTVIWVSSTDPWHRASDIDRGMEQPGLDLVYRSGLTRGLPMLTPVAMLYGTPEDAANEVRYLRARKHAVTMIELGEEPDGQNVAPEDYAVLFSKWARAIHAVDPSLRLGGPAFQSTYDVIAFWPDARKDTSWMRRFLHALERPEDFAFFSFEWYPFDDVCDDPRALLRSAPAILTRVLDAWREEGVPRDIPWLATEYGWSSYAGRAEVTLEGALFNTEFVADFLSRGGAAAYFYGYEPEQLMAENRCASEGNLLLFIADEEHRIVAKAATYWAARMLTHNFLLPHGAHVMHAVTGGTRELRAYAVTRPDGSESVLIINVGAATTVRIAGFAHSAVTQYSAREYAWSATAKRPLRSLPPAEFEAGEEVPVPALSITVVRAGKAP